MSFREMLSAIKNRELSPVYILQGEEPYFIDRLVDAFEEYVVDEADRDFDFKVYYGAEADIEAVAAHAKQYPLMSDRQLVILKEAQSMQQAKTQLDKLEQYVLRPTQTTVFVIAFKGDKLGATSKLMKAASKSGVVVFTSDKVRDYQLAGPIRDYCTGKKIGIEDGAVDLLAQYVGNDLSKLFGEIDKLIVACGKDTRTISAEMVQKNIGVSKEFNNFELTNALTRRDYAQASRIVDYFARNPKQNPTVVTAATIFNFFSRLAIAHYLADKSDSGLKTALNLKNPYALGETKQAMRAFNARQTLGAISAIREFDCHSKGIGTFQNEFELLKELIFRIFTLPA